MIMCQSCGMPLKETSDHGSQKDGSPSDEYCNLCYGNGEFYCQTDNVKEFIAMVVEKMKAKKVNPIIIFLAKLQIPSLKRWKK